MTGMVSYKELDVPEAMAYVLEVVGQDKSSWCNRSWSCNWYYGCNLCLHLCNDTCILRDEP